MMKNIYKFISAVLVAATLTTSAQVPETQIKLNFGNLNQSMFSKISPDQKSYASIWRIKTFDFLNFDFSQPLNQSVPLSLVKSELRKLPVKARIELRLSVNDDEESSEKEESFWSENLYYFIGAAAAAATVYILWVNKDDQPKAKTFGYPLKP